MTWSMHCILYSSSMKKQIEEHLCFSSKAPTGVFCSILTPF